MECDEIAALLNVSKRTVERRWRYAMAELRAKLSDEDVGGTGAGERGAGGRVAGERSAGERGAGELGEGRDDEDRASEAR